MGLYFERNWKLSAGVILLIAAFLMIYVPWIIAGQELFRQESVYAVEALEYVPGSFVTTAHGVPDLHGSLMFPAVAYYLNRITGLPIENIMRGISCFMLAAGAVLVYFAAASQRTSRAGLVASAFYLTPLIAMEKAVEGHPATASAFFLLAAQLVFFYYGVRRSNWNKAWIFSACLISLGFFCGGLMMLFYFIAPMFFFRRPLSVKSKFKTPGFAAAVLLLVLVAGAKLVPFIVQSGNGLDFFRTSESFLIYRNKYFLDLAEFAVLLPLRLMPWTLIAWLPFCVALQDLDKTPIFSRYLRTLTFVILAAVWLLSDTGSRAIFYFLGPLAIQTGITYELGTRRYGERIRKALAVCESGAVMLALAFAVVKFAPEKWLTPFVSLSNSLDFRNTLFFSVSAVFGGGLLFFAAIFFRLERKKQPLWVILVLISVCIGIFYGIVMAPYRAQVTEKKRLGADLKKVMKEADCKILYKSGIDDLYGELFYTGVTVKKLYSIRELPQAEPVVFLIGTEFPGTADRSWSNLLPNGYTYNNYPLSLWKGVLRDNE